MDLEESEPPANPIIELQFFIDSEFAKLSETMLKTYKVRIEAFLTDIIGEAPDLNDGAKDELIDDYESTFTIVSSEHQLRVLFNAAKFMTIVFRNKKQRLKFAMIHADGNYYVSTDGQQKVTLYMQDGSEIGHYKV